MRIIRTLAIVLEVILAGRYFYAAYKDKTYRESDAALGFLWLLIAVFSGASY